MSGYAPTPSEQKVLALLVSGHDVAEIAATLVLSPFTVRNVLARLRKIYGTRHTIALVALIWQRRQDETVKQLAECERVRAALDRRGRS